MRTCIACREEGDRDALIRLVRHPEDGSVVVDLRANLPGRGAWVHPTRSCVHELEERPGPLARAFKAPTRGDGLLAAVRDAVWRALLDGLSLAAAGGALVGGHDALEASLRAGEVDLLVVASDASERTVRDLVRTLRAEPPLVRIDLDRDALGAQVGTAPRAALGVKPVGAAIHLRRQLRRWVGLG